MRAKTGVLIAVVGAVLMVSGCSAPEGVAAPPVSSPVVTQAETPVATDTPAPPEPALAFDGDCANAIADPAAYVSDPMDYPPQTWPSAVATLGGLVCSWYGASGEAITVSALPEDVVTGELTDAYQSMVCETAYDGEECRLSGSAAGTWILVSAPRYSADPELQPVLEEALAAAEKWADPVAPTPDDQWWDKVDCAELGEAIDIGEVFGGADYEEGYPTGFAPSPIADLVEDSGVNSWCPWYSYDTNTGVWMNVLPGAGFQWDRIDGKDASVDGAEAAVTVEQFDTKVLVATDGTNIVTVQESPTTPADLAERVLAALD